MKKLNVAIVGQGRSGRDIHGKYFKSEDNKYFNVVAVVDALEHRRVRAAEEYGCDVYEKVSDLYGRDDIDLVVNSTFSHLHAEVAIDLMNHGFNVVSEKPFAIAALTSACLSSLSSFMLISLSSKMILSVLSPNKI